ncbi:MAG: CehA/McbA family metallohydrolase [Planctomycetaceae bacterium]|nr:CehA/McbA family metallohydrolase [Planctomycetaceae bacterium]
MFGVEQQPFVAATERLIQALDYVGAPLSESDLESLRMAMQQENAHRSVGGIQKVLDSRCLAFVTINPESRVSVVEGPVARELVQQGWRTFLVKVHNEAEITAVLDVGSPQAGPSYQLGRGARQKPQTDDKLVTASESAQHFLDIASFGKQPLKPQLSGLEVEYRIVQLFSRDVGKREATLTFNVGQGTQDLGFRSELPVLFESLPAVKVTLGVYDEDGSPTTAAFVFRDQWGRVYPNPARRLAPDFFFHDQIYRAHGETVDLPPGDYSVVISRGPEYHVQREQLFIPTGVDAHKAEFRLQRWIHPAKRGWFSGDHHVHAAGCKHYDSPTEGVGPEDMLRHIVGEDLNVGCVLTWGPCWYTQKQYFEGKTSALSRPSYLMRYDVEVSGFPSSHAGHLCLLRLSEDDYPGTTVIEDWPSWTHPVLKWCQDQGGVAGYSHSGWGLGLPDYAVNGGRITGARLDAIPYPNRNPTGGRAADKLPDYAMPPFDGIGANEYIVTTALGSCDFISAVDTPAIWELNIWYHTLNCGMTSRISGETDFPCIYGDKVGLGRIYVKMPHDTRPDATAILPTEDSPLDYDEWVRGLKDGRSYCGDGLSHVLDLRLTNSAGTDTVSLGEPGPSRRVSQLNLAQPGKVKVDFDVSALLEETQNDETRRIRTARLDQKPYWHIERCRIGDGRTVPVEVIVNGQVAATKEIEADGSVQSLSFDIDIPQSAWVAVRILPSVHTNPIWVTVADQPVRASKKSAEWCRRAVDVCWNSKEGRFRDNEKAEARAAYDQAAKIYEQVRAECKID